MSTIHRSAPPPPTPSLQPSLTDLGTHLAQVEFCVLDLETTGGSAEDTITEIGAVRVQGGELTGEFQTLVNPHTSIPPLIAVLTGITNQMVADAPRLEAVLPALLEFLQGRVLVAHNARFDVGFLKRACAAHDMEWPNPTVLDTAALARQILLRDEVANCKLGTLAAHFGATTTPNHRALSDARATVDVLHGLLERVGNLGVHTVEDLREFMLKVSPQRRAKRVWAQDLPNGPGVYAFHADFPSEDGSTRREVLYVGTSTNVRRRVAGYFTASEKRPRMEEMVRVATGLQAWPCATTLEANVRELRMIQSHRPRYNRKSRNQSSQLWIKLTVEAFPRLSVVREVRDDRTSYLGPFGSRRGAEEVCLALQDAFQIRQCTARLSRSTRTAECAVGQMGRCAAPCRLDEGAARYARLVAAVHEAMRNDVRPVITTIGQRVQQLSQQQRFEEAAEATHRLEAYLAASTRNRRIGALAGCPQIVAARRIEGTWQIHVIRHGRLSAAHACRDGEFPPAVAGQVVASAESVLPPVPGTPAASTEECELIAAWLEQPGTRLISVDGEWSWPLHGASNPETLAEAIAMLTP